MKLQHKIASVIIITILFILIPLSTIYSKWSYDDAMIEVQKELLNTASESAQSINLALMNKLSITSTVASAPIVQEMLKMSNSEYSTLSDLARQEKIENLNQKWIKLRTTDDSFIQSYLTNTLSLYLEEQKKVLPGEYGEVFITNRYGVMIASTGRLSTLSHNYKYWWKEAYNDGKGKVFIDDRGYDDSVDGYVIGVVVPIKKDGEIIGMIKSNFNISNTLNTIVDHYHQSNTSELKIVRTNGLVVLEHGSEPLSTKIDFQLLDGLKNLEHDYKAIAQNDKTTLTAYTPIQLAQEDSGIAFGGQEQGLDHSKGNSGELWHTVVMYDKDQALAYKKTDEMIIYMVIFFILVALLIAMLIGRWISLPINKLALVADRIGKGEHELKAEIYSNDEVGKLAASFNAMLKELKNTMASRDQLLLEIERRKKVESELQEKKELIIDQSRHAAMGEMIGMIAHQWRQPLSTISMTANNMLLDISLGELSTTASEEYANSISDQTQHLSQTIDDFRNFFKPDRVISKVNIKHILDQTLSIVKESLSNNTITLTRSFETEQEVNAYPRELMQVFVNIITNAKDALKANTQEHATINIRVYEDKKYINIEICDNGGGIDTDILPKVFDPYFSTKDEKTGKGLGLYMSKMIIENHLNGILEVKNKEYGTCFTVRLVKELAHDQL